MLVGKVLMTAFRFAFLAPALALVLSLVTGFARAEDRLALIIGNDSYQNLRPLQKARNDARAVAGLLGELAYDVTLLEDADRRTTTKALSDLAARIEPGAEVVFYFAGHGVEISGRNYLIPTDAPAAGPDEEAFLTAESLAVDQVLETIRTRGARITLLILDACRDNPFPKADTRSVGGTRGLAPIAAPEGTFILFSAGAGQAALDGMGSMDKDPNSVFTRALLQLLQDGDRPFQEIARAIRRDVESMAATVNHKQRPAYYDELTDDFYLTSAASVRGATAIDEPVETTSPDQPEVRDPDTVADVPPLNGEVPNDAPCFLASSDFVKLQYPYDVEELLAFAQTHAACPALAQSAIDMADAFKNTAPDALKPETWRIKQGVSEGYMNVRDGRGTEFPVLFRITEGTGGILVHICLPPEAGGTKDWCMIEYQGQRGWVSSGGIEKE
jgi:hypothetical protein